ncbi:MAG: bacterioferritin [Desulfovibrio sp.]|jgi:bacterioferritin|nr:bacterioferritin [Desulfovibrio sp.]
MVANKKGKKEKVIDVLNKARAMELHAIHQYMNQHYNLDDKDYGELAVKMKLIAIDEMRHAESFAERIKKLGGEPTTQREGSVKTGQSIQAIYKSNAEQEDTTIEAYSQFCKICQEQGDTITVRLFEQMIEKEQIHLNYYENTSGHIKILGNIYLAKIAGTASDTGSSRGGASGSAD